MAINKTEDFDNGTSITYWKISDLELPEVGNGSMLIKGYKDADTRNNGKKANVLRTKSLSLTSEQVHTLRLLVLSDAYSDLKALTEFTGATDC